MSTITKEIQSAIDAAENIVDVIRNLEKELTSYQDAINQLWEGIEKRDKIITQQEEEIAGWKQDYDQLQQNTEV